MNRSDLQARGRKFYGRARNIIATKESASSTN